MQLPTPIDPFHYYLRLLLLGAFLGMTLSGSSQSSLKRIEVLQRITEYCNQNDFENAYKSAKNLADYHLQNDELRYYINYLNKANNYQSEFNQDSAVQCQIDLMNFMVLNREKIKQSYFKIVFDDFISMIKKSNVDFDVQSKLKELLNSLENDSTIPDYLKRKHWVEKEIGKYNEVKQNHHKAILYYLKAFQTSDKKDFETYRKLGSVLFSLDEYGPAIDIFLICLNKAEDTREKAVLTNLVGNSFYRMNKYSAALYFYEVSLYYRNLLSNEKGSLLPIVYQNIGNIQHLSGNAEEGLNSYLKSLKFCMEYQPDNQEMAGDIYNNLGNYYLDHVSPDSAIYYYNKGLQHRKKLDKDLNFYQLQSYYNLANSYLKKSEIDKVIAYTDSAFTQIDIIKLQGQRTKGSYSDANLGRDIYFTNNLRAKAHRMSYLISNDLLQLELSLAFYKSSILNMKSAMEQIYYESSKLQYVKVLKQNITDALDLQLKIDSITGGKDTVLIYNLVESCHNSQLLDIIAKKRITNQVVKSDLYNKIIYELFQKQNLVSNFDSSLEPEFLKLINDLVEKSEIDRINDNISNLSMNIEATGFQINYSNLGLLHKDELLVEFVVDNSRNRVIYFSSLNGKSDYGIINSSLNELNSQADQTTKALNRFDFSSIDESLKILGNQFSKVLKFDQDCITNLTIIPDGFLWTIPYDAIPKNIGEKESFLINFRNIIFQISSTYLFANRLEASHNTTTFAEWTGFAPVVFNNSSNSKPNDLYSSFDEIKMIQQILKENNISSSIFTHGDANIAKLAQQKDSEFLHLATHSSINKYSNHLGLYFCQQNRKFLLDYFEIINMDLRPKNVFLSVCSSYKSINIDGEGPMNLNRAFLINGTKTIIYTNRNVTDVFAKEFAIQFYTNLVINNEISKSFAITKRQMHKSNSYYSPAFWSNFQLISY